MEDRAIFAIVGAILGGLIGFWISGILIALLGGVIGFVVGANLNKWLN